MLTKICLSLLIFCVLSSKFVSGQEDSLRSALNEIDRRQRDLLDYDEAEYGYPLDRPEDLAFLKTAANYNPERSYGKFAQPLVGYFENDDYDSNLLNKRISSAFRERVEEDNRKQLDELAQNSISNVETEGNYGVDNDEDYEELLKEFWSKYRRPYEVGKLYPAMDKRYYYPQLGMDSIALRKRNRYYDTSAHEYAPTDNFDDDDDDYEINYLRKRYYQKKIN
ncbi:hypothetical protein NQ317_006997 [Molorchus minor]|uniref:Uncharacterized protein n=1 Tax=Molorchus minor TaxID=1323400 RepID=A0ABQ9JT44_9CUCU|nr:hypothetical protein NQ317_006997 [Molorchus minor]